jgi:hypothetical protein
MNFLLLVCFTVAFLISASAGVNLYTTFKPADNSTACLVKVTPATNGKNATLTKILPIASGPDVNFFSYLAAGDGVETYVVATSGLLSGDASRIWAANVRTKKATSAISSYLIARFHYDSKTKTFVAEAVDKTNSSTAILLSVNPRTLQVRQITKIPMHGLSGGYDSSASLFWYAETDKSFKKFVFKAIDIKSGQVVKSFMLPPNLAPGFFAFDSKKLRVVGVVWNSVKSQTSIVTISNAGSGSLVMGPTLNIGQNDNIMTFSAALRVFLVRGRKYYSTFNVDTGGNGAILFDEQALNAAYMGELTYYSYAYV